MYLSNPPQMHPVYHYNNISLDHNDNIVTRALMTWTTTTATMMVRFAGIWTLRNSNSRTRPCRTSRPQQPRYRTRAWTARNANHNNIILLFTVRPAVDFNGLCLRLLHHVEVCNVSNRTHTHCVYTCDVSIVVIITRRWW